MTRKLLVFAFVLLAAPLPGQFAYVANFGANNVSGYMIDATTGALTPVPRLALPRGVWSRIRGGGPHRQVRLCGELFLR